MNLYYKLSLVILRTLTVCGLEVVGAGVVVVAWRRLRLRRVRVGGGNRAVDRAGRLDRRRRGVAAAAEPS